MKSTILLLIIGISLIIGSIYSIQNTNKFLSLASTTIGNVVGFDRNDSGDSITYSPVVEFVTESGESIEFVSSVGSSDPNYSRGENVKIYYLPFSPNEAKIDGVFELWGLSIITGAIGSVFLLIVFGKVAFTKLSHQKEKYLRENGEKITTTIQSIDLNTGFKVNGRSPFCIFTHWKNPATSEIHIFKSKNLWFDPSNYITKEDITVYLDKTNPKKYHVDLSFLPKIAK